jgi:hypothetical protein
MSSAKDVGRPIIVAGNIISTGECGKIIAQQETSEVEPLCPYLTIVSSWN